MLKKALVLFLSLLLLLISCDAGGNSLVGVRIISDAAKGITSSLSSNTPQFNPADYDIYYYAVSRGTTRRTYGASSDDIYRKLSKDTPRILLSQGYWEIFVKGIPHDDANPDSTLGANLDKVPHFNGTSGSIFINIGTDEIVIHVDIPENALGTISIHYTYSSNEESNPSFFYSIQKLGNNGWEDTDYSNRTSGSTAFTEGVFDKEIMNVPAGLYMMTVSVQEGDEMLFSEPVAFSVRGGRTTAITGSCESLKEDRPPVTDWVPQPDEEKPNLSEIIKVTGTDTTQDGEVKDFLSEPIEGNKIYQLSSGSLNPTHGNKTEDRIILTDSVTHFAIDLNGFPLPVNKGNGGNDEESMTVVTIREGQTFSLFNYSEGTTSSFFGNTWVWGNPRYDSTIMVDGGSFICAPEGLNQGKVEIYGPTKDSSADGSSGSHLKQGVIGLKGTGGTIRLDSPNTKLLGVKGISSNNHLGTKNSIANVGTALGGSSNVDITLSNGAFISTEGDSSSDCKASGVDFASGIYLECQTPEGTQTNADIDITMDSGAKIVSTCYASSNDFSAAGIFVRGTSGDVSVTLEGGASIESTGAWASTGNTSSGIYMENVSGDITIDISDGASISHGQGAYSIWLKNCTGNITIRVEDGSITTSSIPIVLENCKGNGKTISISTTSTSGQDVVRGITDLRVIGSNSAMAINNLTGINVDAGIGSYNLGNGTATKL